MKPIYMLSADGKNLAPSKKSFPRAYPDLLFLPLVHLIYIEEVIDEEAKVLIIAAYVGAVEINVLLNAFYRCHEWSHLIQICL